MLHLFKQKCFEKLQQFKKRIQCVQHCSAPNRIARHWRPERVWRAQRVRQYFVIRLGSFTDHSYRIGNSAWHGTYVGLYVAIVQYNTNEKFQCESGDGEPLCRTAHSGIARRRRRRDATHRTGTVHCQTQIRREKTYRGISNEINV